MKLIIGTNLLIRHYISSVAPMAAVKIQVQKYAQLYFYFKLKLLLHSSDT